MSKKFIVISIVLAIIAISLALLGIERSTLKINELEASLELAITNYTILAEDILEVEDNLNEYEMKYKELKEEYKQLTLKYNELKKEVGELKKNKVVPKKKKSSRGGDRRGDYLGVFEATAYTDKPCCQGKWVGQTATGRKPQVGVVAVDPNVIPLNTELYIEGYGKAIAGDTGGAIKGRIIDVFLNDMESCKEWGRKSVKVWKIN